MGERIKRERFETRFEQKPETYDTCTTLALLALRQNRLNERYVEFESTVDKAAEQAYDLFSKVSGRSEQAIRTIPGSCVEMSFILQKLLAEKDIETGIDVFYEALFFHYFLESDDFFIDPTWQQLLPRGTDVSPLPNVLILPKDHAPATAKLHGISERLSTIWPSAKPSTTERPALQCEALEEVFARQGWR